MEIAIPLYNFSETEDPEPLIHTFESLQNTGEQLRKKFKINGKPKYRLLYVPKEDNEFRAEIKITESAVINLAEVKNFVLRLEEKMEADSTTINEYDCYAEGIIKRVHDPKQSTQLPDLLKPLQEMLLYPISIPKTERFKKLRISQGLFKPTGIPESDEPAVIQVSDPNQPGTPLRLNLIGNETEYEDYWILVLKIRQKMKDHFLNSTVRSEAQWKSSVYQPLFEATSLQGLTTGLNALCTHETITDAAITTPKFCSFADGPHALKPDIADGWLVMVTNNQADFSDKSLNLNQEPFKGLEAKFGDSSHLLLDFVVELKKNQTDGSVMNKLVTELGVISSVLQYITQMDNLLTFGYTLDKEHVVLFVMRPLQPLPLNNQKVEGTAPKPRLEATQLFNWDLKDDHQFYEFAIFLWRLCRLRLLQRRCFKQAFEGQKYKKSELGAKIPSSEHHSSSDSSGGVLEDVCNLKLFRCIYKNSKVTVYSANFASHRQLIVKLFGADSLKLLANEHKIYQQLKGLSCVPTVIYVTAHSLGLEFVKGEHYFKPQSLNDVLKYMLLLLKALDDIHSQGVIHSDVKFENVVYDAQKPTIKVIDFGYSIIAVERNSLVPCAGYTERYAAPEVKEWNHIGFASDIFSAGLMFISLLYGVKIEEEDHKFFQQLVSRVENRFHCAEASLIAKNMISRDWGQRMSASEAVEKILHIQPDLTVFITHTANC